MLRLQYGALQLMSARRKLKEVCEALLRQVRQQLASTNGAAPAGKLERGVAPGSFLHHLATAKHHSSVRNGDDFTDMEILQQVHVVNLHACREIWRVTLMPKQDVASSRSPSQDTHVILLLCRPLASCW